MIKYITAKTILSKIRNGPDDYFGTLYSMNIYRGCQHQCIYCDSRSKCYGIENLADILIKKNALELLEKELKSKKTKGTIGLGSMNDAYMPIEKEKKMVKRALELILKYRFPIHIITKSDLVLRDIELIKEIGKTYSAVSLTITAADDKLAKKIEPFAPPSSKRFNAIKTLSENEIYTGIIMTPILPFITDKPNNIEEIIYKGKEAGAKYILAWMGTTQREGQREYFYNELDKKFPGIKEKYINLFGNDYNCPAPDCKNLNNIFYSTCKKVSMPVKMEFYKKSEEEQTFLFK